MTDRLCFLDIDGVLLSYYGSRITDNAKLALDALRDAGFVFVLHSTWRKDMRADAVKLFSDAGHTIRDFCNADEPSKAKAIAMCLDDYFGPPWPDAKDIVVIDDHEIVLSGVTHVRVQGLRVEDVKGVMK